MISIIMPIYNGEKYIDKSIGCILAERDTDIELVLVNDGSEDDSLQICKKYAAIDNRVKIVDKMNGGICSARNVGLATATGEYISFADQDDEIFPGIYKIFEQAISKTNADMVIAGKKCSSLMLVESL